jgi:hypothetical protein
MIVGPINRFERIFQVSLVDDPSLAASACERAMAPIFALGRVYDDAQPTLAMLRDAGVRTALCRMLLGGASGLVAS